jgi:hypothetical protein
MFRFLYYIWGFFLLALPFLLYTSRALTLVLEYVALNFGALIEPMDPEEFGYHLFSSRLNSFRPVAPVVSAATTRSFAKVLARSVCAVVTVTVATVVAAATAPSVATALAAFD